MRGLPFDKEDPSIQRRIPVAQFVNSLKKMPSTGKYYRLSINTYNINLSHQQIFEASFRRELSLDAATSLLPMMVAFHCLEAHRRGERFELTPQIKSQYKFKARYVEELQQIIEQCNQAIIKQ
ncbi:MAG: hypothetical protein J6K78_04210 [Tidjanibacter sp.]|nr:hypothetical protein [Tidjanibacter sp.]